MTMYLLGFLLMTSVAAASGLMPTPDLLSSTLNTTSLFTLFSESMDSSRSTASSDVIIGESSSESIIPSWESSGENQFSAVQSPSSSDILPSIDANGFTSSSSALPNSEVNDIGIIGEVISDETSLRTSMNPVIIRTESVVIVPSASETTSHSGRFSQTDELWQTQRFIGNEPEVPSAIQPTAVEDSHGAMTSKFNDFQTLSSSTIQTEISFGSSSDYIEGLASDASQTREILNSFDLLKSSGSDFDEASSMSTSSQLNSKIVEIQQDSTVLELFTDSDAFSSSQPYGNKESLEVVTTNTFSSSASLYTLDDSITVSSKLKSTYSEILPSATLTVSSELNLIPTSDTKNTDSIDPSSAALPTYAESRTRIVPTSLRFTSMDSFTQNFLTEGAVYSETYSDVLSSTGSTLLTEPVESVYFPSVPEMSPIPASFSLVAISSSSSEINITSSAETFPTMTAMEESYSSLTQIMYFFKGHNSTGLDLTMEPSQTVNFTTSASIVFPSESRYSEIDTVTVMPTTSSNSQGNYTTSEESVLIYTTANVTLMGPSKSMAVRTYTTTDSSIIPSPTENITVVGPRRTTALTFDIESISSRYIYESAIYASAGYENTDDIADLLSDTTSLDVPAVSQSETPEIITPTPTSTYSEETILSSVPVAPPSTVQMSPRADTTIKQISDAPVETAPILVNPIDNISVTLGLYFEYQIPRDTFYDLQDGSTERLHLVLLNIDQSELTQDSWIQFDKDKQLLYGLPWDRNMSLEQEFTLAAVDSAGLVSERDAIVINVDGSADKDLNHFFYITFNTSYEAFINETRNTIDVVLSIATFFEENSTNGVLVSDIYNGSVVLKWTNSSLQKSKCDNDTISAIFDKLTTGGDVSPDFQAALLPKFPVTSVRLEYAGTCLPLLPLETVPAVVAGPPAVATKSESNILLWAIIPAVVVVLLLLVIALVLCYVRRKRRYSGKAILDDEGLIFTNDRKPVLLANELQMRDLSNVPKRPVVLNHDLDLNNDLDPDKLSPPDGADSSSSRPEPPPYYYPDDFDPMLDSLESPPPSYRGSPEGNTPPFGKQPPEYKLPPPYTAHVNPVFSRRGSSEA